MPVADPALPTAADLADPPMQQQQPQEGQQHADIAQDMEVSHGAAATAAVGDGEGEGEAGLEEVGGVPPSQTLPTLLLRVLRANAGASLRPGYVLVLAAHAAMLEAGFLPAWTAEALGGSTPAGAADRAPMGAGGAEMAGIAAAKPAATAAPPSRYALPPECRTSASFYRLRYLAPGLEVAGGSVKAGGERVPARPPSAMLDASMLGGSVLLAARTPSGHLHHASLAAAAYVHELGAREAAACLPEQQEEVQQQQQQQSQVGPRPSTAASNTPTTAAGMHLLLGADLALGSAAASGSGGASGLSSPGLSLPAAGVRALWRTLKDAIAFPMLLAVYADAGLSPPAGLLALPEELKDAVLVALPAPDLAAASAACTALRHLASQASAAGGASAACVWCLFLLGSMDGVGVGRCPGLVTSRGASGGIWEHLGAAGLLPEQSGAWREPWHAPLARRTSSGPPWWSATFHHQPSRSSSGRRWVFLFMCVWRGGGGACQAWPC